MHLPAFIYTMLGLSVAWSFVSGPALAVLGGAGQPSRAIGSSSNMVILAMKPDGGAHVPPPSVLTLRWADRPTDLMSTPRRFLEFVIDGKSLHKRLDSLDFITPLGWIRPSYDEMFINQLRLRAPSELPAGRHAMYVCPECADLGCSAFTAVVSRRGSRVVWSDFARYSNQNGERYVPTLRRTGLEAIGPFEFDAAECDRALRTGLEMLKRHPY